MQKRLESEWRKLVVSWEKSGESQSKYCKSRGIALATFQYWRKKLKGSSPGAFLELIPQVSEESKVIELELPHGIILRVRG